MSHRGGGRRPEGRPEHGNQPASFNRGGDGGRGRGRDGGGRGRGRSGGYPAASASDAYPPLGQRPVSQYPAAPRPIQAPVQTVAPAAYASAIGLGPRPASSSSSSAASLSQEVGKMTLQSTTPSPASGPAPTPLPASSKLVKMPARPGFGTIGQKMVIRANHFLVEVVDKDLHHYDVSITPEITAKKVYREVFNELVRLFKESHLGKKSPAYDGRKSMYTAGPLPFTSKEFVIKLKDQDKPSSSAIKTDVKPRKEREFKVAIKFAAKADLHHLQQFLLGRQRDAPQEVIQALDVVLRESPSNEYTVVGRSFFDISLGRRGELGDGLEYWMGFYQSLRPTQMGLSLNVDMSARAFYEPVLVTEYIKKYFNVRGEISKPFNDRDRIKLGKALRGLRVEISYRDYIRRYKVTGLSVKPTNQLMFTNEEGRELSVAQYFKERYDKVLRYPFLPSLQAGNPARPNFLPMELCRIVEGQRYSKKLNEIQVSNLLKATCQRPNERENSIQKMINANQYNSDARINNEFGLNVKVTPTEITARVLPAPKLKYHESGRESIVDPRVGQWNMINKKMVNGGTVDHWACINFSRIHENMAYEFCDQLIGMCASKGMSFNPRPLIPIYPGDSRKIEKSLVDVHSQSTVALVNVNYGVKRLQLLIVILPDISGSYGTIKRVCETELDIVSQCCQPRQVQKMNKQYLENVSLKINVKVGGRNSVLVEAINKRIPLLCDVPTIIFGADVTHPQPGDDSCPSIAAVVASMDWPEVTKYRALVSAQPHRVEIIEDLYKMKIDPVKGEIHGGMIRELLIAFKNSTGFKPSRIIFYRDGVSEGQFSQVLLEEMDKIRKACVSLQENYLPRVTFVVVQKRHHTRFFASDQRNTDRSGNILPGTVVDTKICHPTEFDFYLNSHAGIQGTSRPAHYHVLYDENNFSADALQTLTNNLCYTYARCTRSVSLVPPAYYAHLAAFRARYYIEGTEFSDSASSVAGGGKSTKERIAEVRPLPIIMENVKNVMFYC